MQERNNSYDIMRGTAIVLMVIGHTGASFSDMIYLFHMPFFFILSGMLYNDRTDNIHSLERTLKNRIVRLYIPYVAFNLIFVLFNNMLIKSSLYLTTYDGIPSDALSHFGGLQHMMSSKELALELFKVLLFMGGAQLGGALWFLRAMFFSLVLFDVEHLVLCTGSKKRYHILLINTLFFGIAAAMSARNMSLPANFDCVLAVMVFYSFGECFKNVVRKIESLSNTYLITIGVLLCVALYFISATNKVNIGKNEYTHWYMLLLTSVMGFVMLYSFALLIAKTRIARMLSFIGMHTIMILGLHMLAFKLLTFIIVKMGFLPSYCIGAFPAVSQYWFVYVLIGIIVPTLVSYYFRNNECLKKW